MQLDGAGLTSFSVERGTLDALVANHGVIVADGGRIWLTAEALDKLGKAMVNNTGLIEAQTVANDSADKPRPLGRRLSEMDVIDADIAGSSLHKTLADFAGEDPIDIDFGH